MRKIDGFLGVLAGFLILSPLQLARAADCAVSTNSDVVASTLPQQASKISDEVAPKSYADLTQAERDNLRDNVNSFQENAEIEAQIATDKRKELYVLGKCGDGQNGERLSVGECYQKQIKEDQARLNMPISDTEETRLKTEIDSLQLKINEPKSHADHAAVLMKSIDVAHELITGKDFSYHDEWPILKKSVWASLKYLIKPGPLLVMAAGNAGWGAAQLTSLNADAKEIANKNGKHIPTVITNTTDYLGYGLEVIPLVAAAFIKKDKGTWQTVNEVAMGEAIGQAMVTTLKYSVRECRPNNSDCLGYPSGHAAFSTTFAAVIWHNYGWKYGVAATAVAGAIMAGRWMENNHSPGELIAGAGYGFAAALAAEHGVEQAEGEVEGENLSTLQKAKRLEFDLGPVVARVHPIGMGGEITFTKRDNR